jgi:hypothetical protein
MRVTDRDLETLSTYMDGQLNQIEQARLEARLQKDPDLRRVYEQLYRTRLVLRSLPRMRAPRNYTLSPRRAPARTNLAQTYPVLRLVTALASFLLVFALLGDFLVFRPASQFVGIADQAAQAPAAIMEAPLAATQESTEMPALEAPPPAGEERQPTSEMLEAAPAAPIEERQALEQAKQLPSIQAEGHVSVTGEQPARARLTEEWAYLRDLEVALAVIVLIAGTLALYQRRRLRVLSPPR